MINRPPQKGGQCSCGSGGSARPEQWLLTGNVEPSARSGSQQNKIKVKKTHWENKMTVSTSMFCACIRPSQICGCPVRMESETGYFDMLAVVVTLVMAIRSYPGDKCIQLLSLTCLQVDFERKCQDFVSSHHSCSIFQDDNWLQALHLLRCPTERQKYT